MKVVIQKVEKCNLYCEEELVSSIGFGLLVLVGVHKEDNLEKVQYLAKKIVNLRIFKDDNNKINKSILDVKGDILVVSNFTLIADTDSGTRPSFSNGAEREKADYLYQSIARELKFLGVEKVELGSFGNHMHLDTVLDGPFTILLEK